MYDLMFKATNKAAWDAWVVDNLENTEVIVDEIGPIVITPAVLDKQDKVITEAVIDSSHHVNVRVLSDNIDCSALAEGNENVEWIDPETVNTPSRIWAGGMNYWKL